MRGKVPMGMDGWKVETDEGLGVGRSTVIPPLPRSLGSSSPMSRCAASLRSGRDQHVLSGRRTRRHAKPPASQPCYLRACSLPEGGGTQPKPGGITVPGIGWDLPTVGRWPALKFSVPGVHASR